MLTYDVDKFFSLETTPYLLILAELESCSSVNDRRKNEKITDERT